MIYSISFYLHLKLNFLTFYFALLFYWIICSKLAPTLTPNYKSSLFSSFLVESSFLMKVFSLLPSSYSTLSSSLSSYIISYSIGIYFFVVANFLVILNVFLGILSFYTCYAYYLFFFFSSLISALISLNPSSILGLSSFSILYSSSALRSIKN